MSSLKTTSLMPEIENKYQQERIRFIRHTQDLLRNYNWDDQLIKIVEEKAEFVKGYHLILFNNGLQEIVDEFMAYQDQLCFERLKTLSYPNKIRERVGLALNTRIMALAPIIHQKNSTYFAYPYNIKLGLQLAWRTCDSIWQFCGDQSIDFNYYTKRGLLESVYLSSILFYIADKSENYSATKEFIEQSIENVIKIGSYKKFLKLPQIEDIPILRLFS